MAEAEALCSLVQRMSPRDYGRILAVLLNNEMGAHAQWAPGWVPIYEALRDEHRGEIAARVQSRLQNLGAPLAPALGWLERTARHNDLLGSASEIRQAVNQMLAGTVILRAGDRTSLGVVVSRDNQQVTVLAIPPSLRRKNRYTAYSYAPRVSKSEMASLRWEACVTEPDQPQWIPATCATSAVFTTLDQYANQHPCMLVRFPLVGRLVLAVPRPPVPRPAGLAYRLMLPGSRGKTESDDPPPLAWWLSLSPDKHASGNRQPALSFVYFTPEAEVIHFGDNGSSMGVGTLLSRMAPQLVPDSIECGRSSGEQSLTFEIFEPHGELDDLRALVGPPCSDQKLLSGIMRTPAESLLSDGTTATVTRTGNRCAVHFDGSADDGTAFWLQMRGQCSDGSAFHAEPLLVYLPYRRGATGDADWLVSQDRQRMLRARQTLTPIPLDHTIQGDSLRFGIVQITDLSVQPNALQAGPAGEHVFVADASGIRRIRLRDFRETDGLLLDGTGSLLAGSSQGLLVPCIGSDAKPCLHVLDRDSLAVRLSVALARPPLYVLGDWSLPWAFLLDDEELTVLDLRSDRILQRMPLEQLIRLPRRTRPGWNPASAGGSSDSLPPDYIARLDVQHRLVHILRQSLLCRFPIQADGMLDPSAAEPPIQLEAGAPHFFDLRADGEYALAGPVYDLRSGDPGSAIRFPGIPLAMSETSGDVLTMAPFGRPSDDNVRLLDRMGYTVAGWRMPGGRPKGVLAHPDGSHYLVWGNMTRSYWIEIAGRGRGEGDQ